MYGKTASSEQFLNRSAMHSTKGSRRGFDLLDQGVNVADVLSSNEKKESFKAALQTRIESLQQQISKMPKCHQTSKARTSMGEEIQGLQNQIKVLRYETINFFVRAAKNLFSNDQYLAIWEEAKKMQMLALEDAKRPGSALKGDAWK